MRTSSVLVPRIGAFIPPELNPEGYLAWAPVSPAHPGPASVTLPIVVRPNAQRRFITDREFIDAHFMSISDPPGHGFDAEHPERTWDSVSPAPRVRLVVLNSCTPFLGLPRVPVSEGAISLVQVRFLRAELRRAQERGEVAIAATHHHSESLQEINGSAIYAEGLRRLLNEPQCVTLHIAGHWHRHAVFDRGGYTGIVTGSIINPPQEGRVIELWRKRAEVDDLVAATAGMAEVELRYWAFSHLDAIESPGGDSSEVFDDPLMPMRRLAAELANNRKGRR